MSLSIAIATTPIPVSAAATSFAERTLNALTEFPNWLASFDALQIPAWAVLLTMAMATVGLIYAVREFLSWFLKTNSIIDEVIRIETLIRDLQGDLASLEATVLRLQSATIPLGTTAPLETAGLRIEKADGVMPPAPSAPAEKKAQFRLDL